MKKILIYGLILLSLCNGSDAMEEKIERNLGNLQILPDEIRYKVIKIALEDYIKSLKDILNFKISLSEELSKINLICKEFNLLGTEELKNFVMPLQIKRFTYLRETIKKKYRGFSKKTLNLRIARLLNNCYVDLEKVVELIIAGGNIDIQNVDGSTPLNIATRENNTEIVRLLLENNANTEIQSKYSLGNETALMRAAIEGNAEIAKLLIKNKADPNIKSRFYHDASALTFAVIRNHIEIARLLIENGVDINIRDRHGMTALILAVKDGFIEIVRLLIENGADINIKDYKNWTALIYACHAGYTEIVKLLLEKDVDIYIEDKKGQTALTLALKEGHTEIAQLLQDRVDQDNINKPTKNNNFFDSCFLQ